MAAFDFEILQVATRDRSVMEYPDSSRLLSPKYSTCIQHHRLIRRARF